MGRSYSARVTAVIAGVHPKWLDNLLSRHELPGIVRGKQGLARRISDDGILAVEVCRILNLELGVSLSRSAEIASLCLRSDREAELHYSTGSGLVLSLSIPATRARLRDRTRDAIETAADVPRGRPPGSRG
jgi:hypothetical protein